MQPVKSLLLQITLVAFLCTGISVPSFAAVMTTQDYLSASVRSEHLRSIDAALMRADVRQLLMARGVNPNDAMQRINALPDADLVVLAEQMDELPAGGDSFLALVGAVFIVLLILELTGVINIFNKA